MHDKMINNSRICVEISKKANKIRENNRRNHRSRSRSLPKKRGRDIVSYIINNYSSMYNKINNPIII